MPLSLARAQGNIALASFVQVDLARPLPPPEDGAHPQSGPMMKQVPSSVSDHLVSEGHVG